MVQELHWHKSSYSGATNNCVEAAVGATSRIRDTQHRALGHLEVSANEWRAFLDAVRARRL